MYRAGCVSLSSSGLLGIHSLEGKGTQGLTLMYGLVGHIAVEQWTIFHDVSVELFSSSYKVFVYMAAIIINTFTKSVGKPDNKNTWQEQQGNNNW